MPKLVRAFACEYGCGRKVTTKKAVMARHEMTCFANPARRACRSCGNRASEWVTIYNPHHGGDPGSTDYNVSVWCCEADDDIDLSEGLRCSCPLWKPRET